MTTREALDLPADLARFREAWESLVPSVRLVVAAEVAGAIAGVINQRQRAADSYDAELLPNFAQCQRDAVLALMLWHVLAVRIARDAYDEIGPQPMWAAEGPL